MWCCSDFQCSVDSQIVDDPKFWELFPHYWLPCLYSDSTSPFNIQTLLKFILTQSVEMFTFLMSLSPTKSLQASSDLCTARTLFSRCSRSRWRSSKIWENRIVYWRECVLPQVPIYCFALFLTKCEWPPLSTLRVWLSLVLGWELQRENNVPAVHRSDEACRLLVKRKTHQKSKNFDWLCPNELWHSWNSNQMNLFRIIQTFWSDICSRHDPQCPCTSALVAWMVPFSFT